MGLRILGIAIAVLPVQSQDSRPLYGSASLERENEGKLQTTIAHFVFRILFLFHCRAVPTQSHFVHFACRRETLRKKGAKLSSSSSAAAFRISSFVTLSLFCDRESEREEWKEIEGYNNERKAAVPVNKMLLQCLQGVENIGILYSTFRIAQIYPYT